MTVFLSLPFPQPKHRRPSVPLPTSTDPARPRGNQAFAGRRPPVRELERYRGSVYSLSVPTSYSPTVYVGIETYVISLDWHNTDDVLSNVPPSPKGSSAMSSTKPKADASHQHLPARPAKDKRRSSLAELPRSPHSHPSRTRQHPHTQPLILPPSTTGPRVHGPNFVTPSDSLVRNSATLGVAKVETTTPPISGPFIR